MQNAAEHYICKGGKKIGEEEKGREIMRRRRWKLMNGGEKTGGMICVRRKLKF